MVIGVDLGGTNVRARAFTKDGIPVGEFVSRSSEGDQGWMATMEATAKVINQVKDELPHAATAERVGLAIPGHVDSDAGIVRWAPNLGETRDGIFHYWKDIPVIEALGERTGLEVRMGNDANLAALGEYRYGSGRNEANCLLMLTLGTGIGGGVVMRSRGVVGQADGPLMLVGGNQGGLELGHIMIHMHGVDASVGSYGSLEAYCQRDAIVRRAVHRLRRGMPSLLHDLCEGKFENVTPKMISDAAAQGDELALMVWSEIGGFLGIGVGTLVNVFAPDVVAIGGQIASAHPYFMPALKREASLAAIPSLYADAEITVARKLSDAGVLGAAALAWMTL